jgi:hypothetical protein
LRLVLNAAIGLLVVAAVLTLKTPAWEFLAAAAACFVAYGFWGITDRALGDFGGSTTSTRVLRTLRVVWTLVGALGVIALTGVVMAGALGNWIH